MEMQPTFAFYNANLQNASDIEGFNVVLRRLLDRLIKRAALGNSTRKFALGNEDAPNFQTIYALSECTPDLASIDCNNCLQGLVGSISQCCNGKQGAKIVTPSCDLKYDTFSFYDPVAASPTPSPLPPPRAQPVLPPPLQLLPPTQGTYGGQ
ncbi:hypothetical protein I3842_04G092500 [Carya illinoinensis]|uniref:Gnk2-homologous domain-containing protein n=1 Tax=Carya illinoinensis TaxID=32201 RepID=A0A922F766_CARIL|nr:hypothetical protein I3842_04G092500 [Carya illinoinensis]